MIRPSELQLDLPMELSNGVITTTKKVWDILVASKEGNISVVKGMVDELPELSYAQYNYTPPIHFAVREGHIPLVKYLLKIGAHDPNYRIYPFLDNLQIIAEDRGHQEIVALLIEYKKNPGAQKYKGDNGRIFYNMSEEELEFQDAVDKGKLEAVKRILNDHPEYVHNETFFWSEGILMMPAKTQDHKMLELLLSYGARVPHTLKWAQAYYFKHYATAVFLMKNGMDPNVTSWQNVTLLHDMAQKGEIEKAQLLIDHGAELDAIDDEYLSTPLGMAARWGHPEMVKLLLYHGADKNMAGAEWSKPIEWAKRKEHTAIKNMLI